MSFGDSSYVQASAAELAQAQQQLTDWRKLAPVYKKNATESIARAESANQRNSMIQGGIGSSVAQVADAQQQQSNTAMMEQGVAPGGGGFLMGNSGNSRSKGIGRALAKGVVANEGSYLMGVGSQIQAGQELLRGTDAARNAIAGLDTQRGALNVYSQNATSQAIGEGIGTAVGMFGTAGGFSKTPEAPTSKYKGNTGGSAYMQRNNNMGNNFNIGSGFNTSLRGLS